VCKEFFVILKLRTIIIYKYGLYTRSNLLRLFEQALGSKTAPIY